MKIHTHTKQQIKRYIIFLPSYERLERKISWEEQKLAFKFSDVTYTRHRTACNNVKIKARRILHIILLSMSYIGMSNNKVRHTKFQQVDWNST
jgi:hypothetical protein